MPVRNGAVRSSRWRRAVQIDHRNVTAPPSGALTDVRPARTDEIPGGGGAGTRGGVRNLNCDNDTLDPTERRCGTPGSRVRRRPIATVAQGRHLTVAEGAGQYEFERWAHGAPEYRPPNTFEKFSYTCTQRNVTAPAGLCGFVRFGEDCVDAVLYVVGAEGFVFGGQGEVEDGVGGVE